MNDEEVVERIERRAKEILSNKKLYCPTNGCGRLQHLKFLEYRNNNWHGGTIRQYKKFLLKYAESLKND